MNESAAKPEPSPFEKMRALAARVVAVPKEQADEQERRWREERAKTTAPRKPLETR